MGDPSIEEHNISFSMVKISQITYLKSHKISEVLGLGDWLKIVFKGDYALPFNYETEERKIIYSNGHFVEENKISIIILKNLCILSGQIQNVMSQCCRFARKASVHSCPPLLF